VQLGVIGQVAVSYFSLLAYQEQLEIYEKLTRDLVEILKLNNQRFKTGVSSQREPYISASEIAQIKAKTQIIKHNIVLTQNALKYLTNQNPGTIALSKKFSNIDSDLIVVSELPLTALNNRPDIQEATSKLNAANAGIGVAQSELLPTVSFANFYRGAAPNFGNSFQSNDLNQLVLAVPVINAQALADIAARNAVYKQVYYQYMQSVVAALRDIDNDISEHAQYTVQLSDNLRALDDIDKTCGLDKARFDSGVNSYLEYINCVTKYDYYRLTIVQLKLGKIMAMVKLYQDLAITKN
jgi:outer membrane protein TolC